MIFKSTRWAVLATVAALLVAAPAALASGGTNSGGVNSGGGGGGGGSTTPPSTGPCAAITSFGVTTGYYKSWDAVWTKYAVTASCPFTVWYTLTNNATGQVEATFGGWSLASYTIDSDFLTSYSTSYTVDLAIEDSTGTVIDQKSATLVTKTAKAGGTA